MRNTYFVLCALLFSLSSCIEEDNEIYTDLNESKINQTLDKYENKSEGKMQYGPSYKKAKVIVVTDLDDGSITTYYDCTESGNSCRVMKISDGELASLGNELSSLDSKITYRNGHIKMNDAKGTIITNDKVLSPKIDYTWKGIFNSDTQTVDCFDPGNNCKSNLKVGNSISEIISSTLTSEEKLKIEIGEVKVYRGKNFIELKYLTSGKSKFIKF